MEHIWDVLESHWYVSALIVVLVLSFITAFFVPAVQLGLQLKQLGRELKELKKSRLDPTRLNVKDARLKHLWDEYCETLHLPHSAIDPRTGLPASGIHRATVPAEMLFNAQSVFEGRIHAEFFKHLPGLLTGIGIIGTFLGLINGLEHASGTGGQLDTTQLIVSVKEAFYVSAMAIISAMLVTFVEKMIVSQLHVRVERLCEDIDALYNAGAGEEYLARLVAASEDSASQAKILKDALVGDLSRILENVAQKQIDAGATQQAALQQTLIAAIDQGLRQPLGAISQGFEQFRSQQGGQITQGLQDSMAVFVDRLEEMLGGQVGQAKELQAQTLVVLENAVKSFQSMAAQVGAAGESATSAMSTQLGSALDDMVRRQTQMNDTMRAFVDDMRLAMTRSQEETSGTTARLLNALGDEITSVIERLRAGANAATEVQGRNIEDLSRSAREAIEKLASEVSGQTSAIGDATTAMRAAVSELSSSTDRNIALMGEGATQMHRAAEQFSGSGKAISEVFDRTSAISLELARSATALSGAIQDVQAVINDYKAARETFQDLVATLRETVATAKRDASMTSDLTGRLEKAAVKLAEAQGRADEYLTHLNGALTEAHRLFASQMLETVRKTNTEAHQHLANSTQLLASTIAELDGTIIDFRSAPRSGA